MMIGQLGMLQVVQLKSDHSKHTSFNKFQTLLYINASDIRRIPLHIANPVH